MSYRVFDVSALDVEADFVLELAIPEESYAVKNPDGTSPVVTLKVQGSTRAVALQVLSQVNESEDFLFIVGSTLVGEDFPEKVVSEPETVSAILSETHANFLTFEFAATVDDGSTVELSVMAPSGVIAFQAFQAMSSKVKLNQLATSFMPLDEDYY